MKTIEEFKKFTLRGDLANLAIGFTVGAAFTTFARSLVDDLLMPPIALLLGGADFSGLFVVLRGGPRTPPPYATLAAANEAGAVTLNYGAFLNAVVTLLVVAIAMFALMRAVTRIDHALDERFADDPPTDQRPANKKCPFCRETIDYLAIRCPRCTSTLDGEAPRTTA